MPRYELEDSCIPKVVMGSEDALAVFMYHVQKTRNLLAVSPLYAVSKHLQGTVHMETQRAWRLYKRTQHLKTRKFCRSCFRVGRMKLRRNLCLLCHETLIPEVNRTVLKTILQIPQKHLDEIPWRYSHRCKSKVSTVCSVYNWATLSKVKSAASIFNMGLEMLKCRLYPHRLKARNNDDKRR